MKITIPAETFVRLANAAAVYNGTDRPHLACVRLEYRNGRSYAVASNSHVMAIEYLGTTDQPDEFMNVATSPELMEYLTTTDFDFVVIEGWQTAGIALVGGRTLILQPDKEPIFTRWFDLCPQQAARVDKGFIYIQEELFRRLALSSPSGKLVFPEAVDNSRVMYIRDADDPNWLGLFLARSNDGSVKPATIPGWL